jgi:hypothetical protein
MNEKGFTVTLRSDDGEEYIYCESTEEVYQLVSNLKKSYSLISVLKGDCSVEELDYLDFIEKDDNIEYGKRRKK